MNKDFKHFMTHQPGHTSYIRRSRWYIASPYSHDDPDVIAKRVAGAQRAEDCINQTYDDVIAYSPIARTADMQERGVIPKEGWYLYDFADLAKSDRLVVLKLDGWKTSIGIGLEIAFALGKGIPITYYTLSEIMSDDIPF